MRLQDDAKTTYIATLKECDIRSLINKHVRVENGFLRIDDEDILLSNFDGILLLGMGKASVEMGRAVELLLGDKIKRGIVVTNDYRAKKINSEVIVAGHPLPNENSVQAALKILEAIHSSSEKTLIIFVISGGGSTLVELPSPPLTLEDWQILNQELVKSGASIFEINLVRKYISRIKGGKLALEIGQRRCIALYLSDVNSGELSTIASGPLLPEVIDKQKVLEIIEKYNLFAKIPGAFGHALNKDYPIPAIDITGSQLNFTHLLLADNNLAIKVAAVIARQKGYRVDTITDLVEGDYRFIADELISRLSKLIKLFPNDKVCLISGGEVNCAVKGQGLGGRNQEFVLYSASKLTNLNLDYEVAILSAGTDGIDGNSVASGAVMVRHRLAEIEQGFLRNNNSFSLIKHLGGSLVIGPTGNNIRDLRIHLAAPKSRLQ